MHDIRSTNARVSKTHLQLLNHLDFPLPTLVPKLLIHHRRPLILATRQPTIGRDPVVVLARQDAHLQRTEDGQAEPRLLVQQREFLLHLFPREQVVLRLLHQRADHVQSVGEAPGRRDLVGVPLGCAPVEGLAGVDQVVEGPDGFFDGGVSVRAVRVDEVDWIALTSLSIWTFAKTTKTEKY